MMLKRHLLLAALALTMVAHAGFADQITIDPDSSADGTDISNAWAGQGVTLSAVGPSSVDGKVYAAADSRASTPPNSFGWNVGPFISSSWNFDFSFLGSGPSPELRADFTGFLASEVSIDTNVDGGATLSAYDTGGSLLGTASVGSSSDTLDYSSGSDNIRYVVIGAIDKNGGNDVGTLDHMVITHGTGAAVPEPGTFSLLMGVIPAALAFRRRK